MKTKYLLIISIFVILMSMTGISASENVNQTDSLGLSVENNFEIEEDEREIIRQKPDEVELKENENGSIDSNILAISNEDEILGKDIYVRDNTFESISNAIAGAESGDIIYLSGTYKNNWKKHIEINKNISIIGINDATLDAQGHSRIFYVTSGKINIQNIVFKNGNANDGGAICFENNIANSNINATFINNNADWGGGANFFRGLVSTSTVVGTYTNNKAEYYGGANFFFGGVSTSNVAGTYINNTASNGGANYFGSVSDSTVTGTYINNNAIAQGGAIYTIDYLSNCEFNGYFKDNTADNGSAIYIRSNIQISDFKGDFVANSANNLGTLFFFNQVTDCNFSGLFKNNKANKGGAAYFRTYTAANNFNGDFKNNNATSGGGALYFDDFKISNSNFTGNFHANSATTGGAIFIGKGADNCDFTGNFTDNFAGTTGGAINIAEGISYCNFDANFINNEAKNSGGAVLVTGEISNANFKGKFINNSANMGAAISLGGLYTSVGVISTNFSAVFINNYVTGPSDQGIIRISNCRDANIVEGSLFINNTAESLIYMDQIWDIETRTRINNNIFIENDCNYIIRSVRGSLNVDYNWLGHTKDNYTNKYTKFVNPDGGTFYYSGWLFLNATADPTNPAVGASSTIRFKLSYYDSDRRSINSNYDNKNLPSTDLTLTSTKGNLNQRVADLDESFSYSPTSSGEGSVTAGIGDVKSTIKLNNTKGTIGLTVEAEGVAYPNFPLLFLSYNELATGSVNIQFTGNKYNLTYTNLPIGKIYDFKGVLPDYYKIKVSYSGDDNFLSMDAYAYLEVRKGDSTMTIFSYDCYINDTGAPLFYVILPRDANGYLTIGNRPPVNVTEIGEKEKRGLVIKLTNDGSWSPGQHNVTFFYSGDDMFKPSSATASCNIFKIPTEIIAEKSIDLFVDNESKINYILKPDGATGEIKFISDNPDVVYVNTTTGVIKALNEGNANIKIQFTGGDYDDSNATVTVTVSRISTEITLANSSFALKVDDVVDSGAGLSPSGAGNLTYTSSDVGVVKVVDGKLVAVGEGSAVVNVSFAGDYKYLPAQNKTISVSVSLINASVSADDLKIDVGGVAAINPVTLPGGLDVLYSIADKNIADVDPSGNVVGINEGTTSITITINGKGKYFENSTMIEVSVSKIPSEIILSNDNVSLKVDDVVDSGASLSPSGAGNLTYASSDEGVVKVVDGKLVAVGVGSAVVNVSFAGDYKYLPAQNKTISVSVSLINASVSADDLKIYVDGVAAINPVTSPGGLDLLYSIADKNIADVDASGKVIGIKEGTTSITITINGKGKYFENSTRIMVTVSKIPTVINVENKSVNLFVEDSLNTGAALNPQEAGNLTYTSSDENVAIVKDGKIIALKEGEAIITVSFAGNNKYAGAENKTINVTVKLKNTSVSVNNETLELFVGDNFTIVATTVPQGLKVKFDTGDDDIIKLDDLGHVTALARGNATIAVSVGDNVVYKYTVVYVNVTVNEKPVPKENLTMHVNAEPITVGEDARVIVTGLKDAAGDVSVIVNGKTYTSPIRNGEATVIVPGLKEDAAGQVLYPGDDNYNNASATVVIVVNPLPVPGKKNLTIKASSDPITVGENATVIVTGLEGATGVVSVAVDGKIFTAPIRNGEASVIVSGIVENVTAYVDYVGDKNYNHDSVSVKITVYPAPKPVKKDLTLHANAEPITVGEDANVIVAGLKDATGDVSLIVNGKTYTSPIRNGEATVIVSGLKENSVGQVLYPGDDNYNNASSAVVIVVNPLPDPEKKNLTIKSDADPITVGENATVIVTGLENASGDVSVIVDGKIFTAPIRNGETAITVSGITENVTAYVDYVGDENYNPASDSVNITVNPAPKPVKKNLTVHANAEPITVGEDANVIVAGLKDATGDVSLIVNGKTYTSPIRNGEASVIVSGLKENSVGQVLYPGDDNYNNASASVVIVVNPLPDPGKKNLTIKAGALPITVGENVIVKVTGLEGATGDVSVIVDGKIFTAPIRDGEASVSVSGITENVTAYVDYVGDDNYNPASTAVKITVKPRENATICIDAPDVTKYFKGSERFVVTVTDYKGNPLVNKSVAIVINGVKYERTTDANGTCSIALNLPANVYNVNTTVDNATTNSVVTILTTVNGTDLVKVFKNATQYYATFRNSEGKYLAEGSVVRFNINGVMYDRKVAANGLAKLNINLGQGKYIITAINPATGEMSSNNITVISKIIENSDLTKYYRNATQYAVKIIGDDGKAVGAGESVTFNINGVFYTRQTNASGIVKLNINLQPGDYIITAEYKNCRVSNNVRVLPVLTAKDLVKKYGTKDQFVATLVDGQGKPYPKQTVTFNINGVFYSRVTESSGQAKLNINLMAGEYIITSTYNGCNIANKITISG